MWAIDLIGNGETLACDNIAGGRDDASDRYYEARGNMPRISAETPGRELTLRLIHRGEILAQSTYKNGECLAAISSL